MPAGAACGNLVSKAEKTQWWGLLHPHRALCWALWRRKQNNKLVLAQSSHTEFWTFLPDLCLQPSPLCVSCQASVAKANTLVDLHSSFTSYICPTHPQTQKACPQYPSEAHHLLQTFVWDGLASNLLCSQRWPRPPEPPALPLECWDC